MPFCLRQAIFVAAVSFGFELLRVGKGRPGDCPSLESLKASVDCASLSEVETAVQTGTSTVTGVLGQIESRVDGGGSLASEVPPQRAEALEYWSLLVGACALGALELALVAVCWWRSNGSQERPGAPAAGRGGQRRRGRGVLV